MNKYSKDLDNVALLLKKDRDNGKAYRLLVKNKSRLLLASNLYKVTMALSVLAVILFISSLVVSVLNSADTFISNSLCILSAVIVGIIFGTGLYLAKMNLDFVNYVNSVLEDLGTVVSYPVENRGGSYYYAKGDDMVYVDKIYVKDGVYSEKSYYRILSDSGKVTTYVEKGGI